MINNSSRTGCVPIKLGRKNWLFFGAERARHHAAAIYTFVENCPHHGLPVERNLKELLAALPSVSDARVIASLTPARVAEARRRQGQRHAA